MAMEYHREFARPPLIFMEEYAESIIRANNFTSNLYSRERKTVCVTSVNSYFGAQLAKKLLAHGYLVRVTIQSPGSDLISGCVFFISFFPQFQGALGLEFISQIHLFFSLNPILTPRKSKKNQFFSISFLIQRHPKPFFFSFLVIDNEQRILRT